MFPKKFSHGDNNDVLPCRYLFCIKAFDVVSSFRSNLSTLIGTGKKVFEGPLLPEVEERQGREEGRTEKDKKQILLEKVQKEIIEEYPAFKEVFYKKYRDNIASMVFNLNGNTNDSELLERLIEDEMIEDFSNFKIKQIENLLKNS